MDFRISYKLTIFRQNFKIVIHDKEKFFTFGGDCSGGDGICATIRRNVDSHGSERERDEGNGDEDFRKTNF
ncbi:hypothetical protein SDC9_195984 [bioreactor metagenome]|uniref:Uncharacterized protein n=1 Tax=bioreactor metagenome TaxID=1076179 RepID=A0A645IAM5_9ZZZZ